MHSQRRFNLIVTNLHLGDMDAAQLAHEIKAAGLDVPVVVLAYDYREIQNFIARNPRTDIDRIFLWQGNARILLSIVNYIEDKRNALHDTKAMSVPVLLVVEDDIRYYSLFLPVIYTEIISQSRRLLSEALNVAHKLVRMRARPKILLCSNYEDAERQVLKYREYLLGVVSDVEFPRGGRADARGRLRTGAHGAQHRARHSDRAAIQPHRVHGAGASRGIFLSAEALAHSAGRLAQDPDRGDGLRRFHLSPPRWKNRSRPRRRSECAGNPAANHSGREPCLPRRTQSLLALADGANRICPGAEVAAAHGQRFWHPRESCAAT